MATKLVFVGLILWAFAHISPTAAVGKAQTAVSTLSSTVAEPHGSGVTTRKGAVPAHGPWQNSPIVPLPAVKNYPPGQFQLSRREKADVKMLPPVYDSRANDWGCCRTCLGQEVHKKLLNRFQPKDPSRLVNCCPECPWPSDFDNPKLGPWMHYFRPYYPTQQQHYEKELDAYALHERKQPASFLEKMAILKARRMSTSVTPTSDPYASLRSKQATSGMPDMERNENYVYGFPGQPKQTDAPPVANIPPCCNVCTSATQVLDPKQDTSCCFICASSFTGSKRRFTRREMAHAMDFANSKAAHQATKD